MDANERNEIEQLPEKYRPIGAWRYVGYMILFGLPIAGFICLLLFALDDEHNINRRNFARSYLCYYLISVIALAVIIGAVVAIGFATGLWQQLAENFSHMG